MHKIKKRPKYVQPQIQVFRPYGFLIETLVEDHGWMQNTYVDGQTVGEVLDPQLDAFPSATFDGYAPDEWGYDIALAMKYGPHRLELEFTRRDGSDSCRAEVWAPTQQERQQLVEWVVKHLEVRGDNWQMLLKGAESS